MLASSLLIAASLVEPPTVVVDRDNVEIRESCVLEIRADPIPDIDNNGVIHILADGITVEFSIEHREMMGAADGVPRDEMTGIGIRIDGRRNVIIRNAHAHRYKVGIYASGADGLLLEDCDVAGGYAQRLGSTPAAEHSGDWLWPHRNDNNEWMTNYGAGIYIEDSTHVVVRDCFARGRQNGIILDNVSGAQVYDNDCSFLSGWGLAMWRASRNVISRNSFDFCVRGYSHGVYNRGQDSAGILMFEQCSDNVIAENSATHGGDGLFAFAGRDALGETWLERERERLKSETGLQEVDQLIVYPRELLERLRRLGNNRNLFINNDFSYAAAHGLELTFSFNNQIIGNRFVENAICGIWGGYSQDTLIADNEFTGNGGMPYGLERGGVNIEHGRGNLVLDNRFMKNACGVHLWWDEDEGLTSLPWAKANHEGATLPQHEDGSVELTARPVDGGRLLPSAQNMIAGNTFDADDIAIHLRSADATFVANNQFRDVNERTVSPDSKIVETEGDMSMWKMPKHPVLGENQPIGGRQRLGGRAAIMMTEWGPYDWREPYLHPVERKGGTHVYRLLGRETIESVAVEPPHSVRVEQFSADGFEHVRVMSKESGEVRPYRLTVTTESGKLSTEDVLVHAEWLVTVFHYENDPREKADDWRDEAKEKGVTFTTPALSFQYGHGSPSALPQAPAEVAAAEIGADHFGTIAHTTLTLPAGKWRVLTQSDDGIRVWIDDALIIDDWTWHPPKRNDAVYEAGQTKPVVIRVEHFELDGFAVLEFGIEPVRD